MTKKLPALKELARSDIELEFGSLASGVSLSGQLCPACKGGGSAERSLSISRGDDGILRWMCHRASCGFRGIHSPKGVIPNFSKQVPTEPKGSKRTYSEHQLPDEIKQMLNDRFLLTEQTIRYWNLRWAPEYDGRVILPVKGPNLEDRGVVLRNDYGAPKKALTSFNELGKPNLAWFLANQSEHNPLYIVEDIYSALRLWQAGVHAVALIGTHLNTDRVREIGLMAKALDVQPFLALDLDAFGLSVKYAIEYRDMCRMTATKINKDVKDMSEQELNDFLNGM